MKNPLEIDIRELQKRLKKPQGAHYRVRLAVGRHYRAQPIPHRTGRLEQSMEMRSPEGVVSIEQRQITVSTAVPYARFTLARRPVPPPPAAVIAEALALYLLKRRK